MTKRFITRKTMSIAIALMYLTAGSAQAFSKPVDQQKMAAGFNAFKAMCASCHTPDPSVTARIAPPIFAIKRHYHKDNDNFDSFRDALVSFVIDPSAENARMKGAIERFGLMPKMPLDEALTNNIAYYLYHTPMGSPNWFKSHYLSEEKRYKSSVNESLESQEDYKLHGLQLAMQTKSALGSRLKSALNEGGPAKAVAFCSNLRDTLPV